MLQQAVAVIMLVMESALLINTHIWELSRYIVLWEAEISIGKKKPTD